MKERIKRIIFIVLCIFLQVFFTVTIFTLFSEYFGLVEFLLRFISALIVLSIIKNSNKLSSNISWIILIMLSPIFGTILFIMVTDNLYHNKMLRTFIKKSDEIKDYLIQDDKVLKEIGKRDTHVYGQMKYISTSGFPVYNNDGVKYYKLGEEAFPVMKEELEKAKKFIFMEYFIIAEGKMWDEILEILKRKVKEGVEVRVIYDDFGCITTLDNGYDKYLESMGIKCICFNKLNPVLSIFANNRDHRKILVIDGNVAFSGGINIADEYINHKVRFGIWKDNAIMVKGEATWNFTIMFLNVWNIYRNEDSDYNKYKPSHKNNKKEDGFVIPYASNPLQKESLGEDVYLNIVNQANKYLYIFTPYLIINSDMISSLVLASKRGVDVKIITPGIPDKKIVNMLTKSYYEILIKNGIEIYEYTPGFIHSKVFVCDDAIATVGTINLDYRSIDLNFECGVYLFEAKEITEVKEDAIETIGESHLVTLEEAKSNFFKKIGQAFLRLFAPLM